nr:carboxyl transferase domain-containing protein [Virgibacillus sp. NKC19-3]
MSEVDDLENRKEKIKKGGHEKYHQKNDEKGKRFVRKRLELLFDQGVDIEDALFANNMDDSLPSDGVVTGIGKVNGQDVCVMANDSTVKAGSWEKNVEKLSVSKKQLKN